MTSAPVYLLAGIGWNDKAPRIPLPGAALVRMRKRELRDGQEAARIAAGRITRAFSRHYRDGGLVLGFHAKLHTLVRAPDRLVEEMQPGEERVLLVAADELPLFSDPLGEPLTRVGRTLQLRDLAAAEGTSFATAIARDNGRCEASEAIAKLLLKHKDRSPLARDLLELATELNRQRISKEDAEYTADVIEGVREELAKLWGGDEE